MKLTTSKYFLNIILKLLKDDFNRNCLQDIELHERLLRVDNLQAILVYRVNFMVL